MKTAVRSLLTIAAVAAVYCCSEGWGQIMESKGVKDIRIIQLPPAKKDGTVPVEKAIAQRRSIRSFANIPLSMSEIAQVLFAAQGITDTAKDYRAAPSAGATFPLEVYCVTGEGVFHYLPKQHALENVKSNDIRGELASAAFGQQCMRDAPAIIVLTAVFSRTTDRYGKRGVMYVYMEAGHVAENIHLEAVALALGSVPVGAFDEDKVRDLIGCGKEEKVLYCIPVGRASK